MVDEIARNHLSQQELDEDDPARIFGQAVESERVKRAREEVTLESFKCISRNRQGPRRDGASRAFSTVSKRWNPEAEETTAIGFAPRT